jgi:hypothetical protein
MEKETATEWLFKQLWEEPKDKFTWNAILMKAKEMEKEQIIQAYYQNGWNDNDNEHNAEQYYNQTFKQD